MENRNGDVVVLVPMGNQVSHRQIEMTLSYTWTGPP